MSQRARLLAAMTYVAARDGYAGASVARVIERAGVSRATFYAHFRDREDCFTAAYRAIASEVRSRLGRAAAGAPTVERRRGVLEALLADAAAYPDSARLVLIEALGGPPQVRAEHERFIRESERWIETRLRLDGPPALEIPTAALLSAVTGVISSRLLSGDAASLPCLLERLLAWVDCYALPDTLRRQPGERWEDLGRCFAPHAPTGKPPSLLPRGPSALPPAPAAAARRERLIAAIARLTASKGYASLTVEDIVATARVPRRAFYSCFRNKEDAVLAAQTVALQRSIGAAAAEFSLAPSWPEQVWRAGAAMLSYIAAHPDLAHLGIIEVYAVGEAAVRRTEDSRMAYGLFLEQGYAEWPAAAELRDICTEAIAAAIYGLLRRQAISGRVTEMLSILPQAVYVILAPFIGPEAALDFVAARARAAHSEPRTAPARSLGFAGRA
jgi:AcrR family transcriptional regulator